ncbi:hypothetical protein TrVFT333_001148 [Trichoderma virens FT-333]|nr:hypothetical protein TrVFT333_001148 [Trichoderma virens FT-333]
MANRLSMFSMASEARGGGPQSQVSTTTLLNSIHNIYLSSQPHQLDASTSVVVNTWLTAAQGGPAVDATLASRAWEHARRRAEDGCIVLGSLHQSTPSLLVPFLSSFPFAIPSTVYKALEAVQPLLRCVTPHNPAAQRQAGLGVTLALNLAGNLTGATLALSQGGIDTSAGLLNIPAEAGYRAFDVFYYLLTSASTPAEREFLGLKSASAYTLLSRSGTYDPPSYLPTADDSASADDFRQALKDIGIKGSAHRNFISTLAGLLKLGDTLDYSIESEALEEICEDVGGLLGIDPEVVLRQCSTEDRKTLVGGLYESLVDWVISKANDAIAAQLVRIKDGDESLDGHGVRTPTSNEDNGDTVAITVLEVPDPAISRALCMRSVFDDTQGINAEMIGDGFEIPSAGSSILREVQQAVSEAAPDLGITTGPQGRERQHELEKRRSSWRRLHTVLMKAAFSRSCSSPLKAKASTWAGLVELTYQRLAALPSITSAWSAGTVSRQLRSWRLPEWANRRHRNLDFTADFDVDEFVQRYAPLGCRDGREGIETWMLERGWSNGEVFIGKERIWIRENAWWEAESSLDIKPGDEIHPIHSNPFNNGFDTGYSGNGSGANVSRDHLVHNRGMSQGNMSQFTLGQSPNPQAAPSIAPSAMRAGDYGLGNKGDTYRGDGFYNPEAAAYDTEYADNKIESKEVDNARRAWVAFTWAMTWWIPSPLLKWIGGMKRPDVRMAWREKLALCMVIVLINGIIIFWIVGLGRVLCPNMDKAWNRKEVSQHQGTNDYYVSIRGGVYDLSKFWKQQHSDTNVKTTSDVMLPLAGADMDDYIIPPLNVACPGLGLTDTFQLVLNNTLEFSTAQHLQGPHFQPDPTSKLANANWYWDVFEPAMEEMYKGQLVYLKSDVQKQGNEDQRMWAMYGNQVYDLTNYFHTLDVFNNDQRYTFLNQDLTDLWKNNPGTDIKEQLDILVNDPNNNGTVHADLANSWLCIQRVFIKGIQYQATPLPQDKFVICQVPAYTEGEDSLRKALDSLTALQYDNKRKLICIICDGMVVGGGNDRPTPKIVLDILGVDPKVDPPALAFKAVGPGSDQLNYAKVYSGLYEYEGNVVPYLVVVKVGKESEQTKSKPGNRGKRDSQILLMSFLNRVHHRSPMNPLELEMFNQINNVIGVDPELYEYLLMVDADTCVQEDSLNRLVAACAHNAKIAGICGETSLENDQKSWWTMIQVYEYYISHHMAKAFESLFGSVTCLPGCFTMYRLRTADKGKPLIISDAVIRDYSVCDVDTLHQKNLLSLGEDRYLTTLMTKHFPSMQFKFLPHAQCKTAAPESWSVLLSQRRRWINSTIHNLVELMRLKDMCGFCFFGMRFIVFIDLFGTIILPATCAYLGYMIYSVATHPTSVPLWSLVILAAVYGLQALIFILKRQWQHIGWMIIYILAYPIYSFALPVYSFWNQDNFSWGNTRVVIGEKGNKQVVAVDDEGFNPRSIPLQLWDDYALSNGLPGRRGTTQYQEKQDAVYQEQYEMDEMKSVYSAGPQGSVLTGMHGRNPYMPPSPAPFAASHIGDPTYMSQRQSMMSMGTAIQDRSQSPYSDFPQRTSVMHTRGPSNLIPSPGLSPGFNGMNRSSSAMSFGRGHEANRSTASFDFMGGPGGIGSSDAAIIEAIQTVLRDVDLDTVTKKQVRALVEQRLQTELVGERRTFVDKQIDRELENM